MPGPVEIVFLILLAPWLMLPAVLANMAPVLLKGKMPLDFGKDFFDGRRFLGDGKTIEGTIGGTMIGTFVGLAQFGLLYFLGAGDSQWGFGTDIYAILIIALIAFGALFGDLLGSFLKRRLNFKRGAKFPVMDQYDLVIGVFILLLIFPFARPWALDRYLWDWHFITFLTIIVGTFAVHRISNIVAYKLGWKDVPY